jgi:hypothetical protein
MTSMCLVIGLCVGLLPVGTAAAAPGDQYYYTGPRFSDPHICILVHAGVWTSWPVAAAAAYFDSSGKVDLVVRTEAQGGCGTYAWNQILHIRQSTAVSSVACSTFAKSTTSYPIDQHPWNTHYTSIYGMQDGSHAVVSPTITLDSGGNPECYSTPTRLANTISKGIGRGLGLEILNYSVPYSSVMATSDYSRARVPWATTDDRNAIYYLYMN